MSTVVSIHRAAGEKPRKANAHSERQGNADASWRVVPVGEIDAWKWVQDAIKGQEHEWFARALWTNQPNLRQMTERLALFISPWWPDAQGASLLSKTIQRAVRRADRAIQEGDGSQIGRLTAVYLAQLAGATTDIARLEISGIDKASNMRRWSYFSEPLMTWADRMDVTELVGYRTSTEPTDAILLGIRTHLVASLAQPIDAGYLAKYANQGD